MGQAEAVTRPRAGEAATERRVRAGLNRVTPRWRRVRGNDAATGHDIVIMLPLCHQASGYNEAADWGYW